MSDDQTPAWVKAMETRMLETRVSTRTAIMERIDRLQARMGADTDRIMSALEAKRQRDAE
jgi:hypothetical protein